jgi:hypothetical protein
MTTFPEFWQEKQQAVAKRLPEVELELGDHFPAAAKHTNLSRVKSL